ncbi:hypothetical protein EVJ50_11200 [Synechococcus sp. RSCCF101]|uniref:hypothetical protein n=1 Tax=Synechococcus sp. RSCCF101 TaxID=2511069 RepID=UPI0012462C36|nr:hypothetical protein [Synechococcus sp. RSCCF101]QEY32707.1 hypothetical protein EVJ50_11200 [Synechococcus sp. RSCCF101]
MRESRLNSYAELLDHPERLDRTVARRARSRRILTVAVWIILGAWVLGLVSDHLSGQSNDPNLGFVALWLAIYCISELEWQMLSLIKKLKDREIDAAQRSGLDP